MSASYEVVHREFSLFSIQLRVTKPHPTNRLVYTIMSIIHWMCDDLRVLNNRVPN